MSQARLRSIASTLAAAVLFAAAVSGPATAEPGGTFPPYPHAVGDLHPDFAALDQDDTEFRLSDQRGRVVLLHVCTVWCGVCRDSATFEAALVSDVNAAVGQDNWVLIDALFQNNAGAASDRDDAQAWRQFLGTPARTLHADNDSTSELHQLGSLVPALPVYAVIGKDGRVASIIQGFTPASTPQLLAERVINAWFRETFEDGFEPTVEARASAE